MASLCATVRDEVVVPSRPTLRWVDEVGALAALRAVADLLDAYREMELGRASVFKRKLGEIKRRTRGRAGRRASRRS